MPTSGGPPSAAENRDDPGSGRAGRRPIAAIPARGARCAARRSRQAARSCDVKLQRMRGGIARSCRITIWPVRRGPSLPARNTLSSSSTRSSSASKVQTSRCSAASASRRPVAEAVGLHRGVQVKAQRVVGLGALDAAARRRRERVLAVEPRAVWRQPSAPADASARTAPDSRHAPWSAARLGRHLAIAFRHWPAR